MIVCALPSASTVSANGDIPQLFSIAGTRLAEDTLLNASAVHLCACLLEERVMNSIIYLVGLVVVVMAIVSFVT